MGMNTGHAELYGLAARDLVRAGESIGLDTFELSGPKYVVKTGPSIALRRGYQNFKASYTESLVSLKRHVTSAGADRAWRLELFGATSADNPWFDYCWHRIVCYRNFVRISDIEPFYGP
jgi:hypothetical protein